jgi:hypothetical protein
MDLRDTPDSCAIGDAVLASNAPFNTSLAVVQFCPDAMQPGELRNLSGAVVATVVEPVWIFRQGRWQNPPLKPVAAWVRES